MTKTNFNQFYTDLPSGLADKLRQARVKPEQLKTMSDGEILSLEGIGDVSLEKIRSLYPAELKTKDKTVKIPSKTKKKKTTPKPAIIKAKKNKIHKRSQRYQNWAKKIKKNQTYSIIQALRLIQPSKKKTPNTIELHINTTDTNLKGEINLPHPINKKTKIEIFSNSTIKKIKAGKINFDILIAHPDDIPQITPLAKTLGPKGLMPNLKNKTITQEPQKRAKELTAGSTLAYKTEPKHSIIHLNLGKTDQKDKDVQDNIKSIITIINPNKIKSVYLNTTQSPSVKLNPETITN